MTDPRRLILHRLELDDEQLLNLLLARRPMLAEVAHYDRTIWHEDASVWSDDVSVPRRAVVRVA